MATQAEKQPDTSSLLNWHYSGEQSGPIGVANLLILTLLKAQASRAFQNPQFVKIFFKKTKQQMSAFGKWGDPFKRMQ